MTRSRRLRTRDMRRLVSFDEFAMDAARDIGNAKRAFGEFLELREKNAHPRFYQNWRGDYVIQLPPDYSNTRALKRR